MSKVQLVSDEDLKLLSLLFIITFSFLSFAAAHLPPFTHLTISISLPPRSATLH
jgi:hypothetical protein